MLKPKFSVDRIEKTAGKSVILEQQSTSAKPDHVDGPHNVESLGHTDRLQGQTVNFSPFLSVLRSCCQRKLQST
ncbi:hypothetical protein DPMN_087753 [Dreissena polymorpha]|uniref:Uncharacterized protein n=1 Tax=Dreissena polymorpha TaxID=45954 RepID=A0A9D4KUK1_DREPO|nr:hypothetical protein DPMN_087693 [Dreissena polymorpha]KAH3845472.1 hypothetical protein DPMN_087753 [Dreissena polymorpha]